MERFEFQVRNVLDEMKENYSKDELISIFSNVLDKIENDKKTKREILTREMINEFYENRVKLTKYGDIIAIDSNNGKPLLIALKYNLKELLLKFLNEFNMKRFINRCYFLESENHVNCIEFASRLGDVEMIKILLEHGGDIKFIDICLMLRFDRIDVVKLMIENKADLNKNIDGFYMPIQDCISNEMIKLMIDNNANTSKYFIQHLAENNLEMLEYVLSKRKDIKNANIINHCIEYKLNEALEILERY